MSYLRQLAKIELHSFGSLILCAGLMAGYAFVRSLWLPDEMFAEPITSFIAGFAITLLFGVPLVAMYWAPLYALLLTKHMASWLTVLALASLPALFCAITLPYFFAIHALICGLLIAASVHMSYGLGSNNSFKPKPLRGSA